MKVVAQECLILHSPLAINHDSLGTMRATQHESCNRITAASKLQIIERKQSKVRLIAWRDLADIAASEEAGAAGRRQV